MFLQQQGLRRSRTSNYDTRIIKPASKGTDFNRPGHIFPLIAKEGVLLRRAGHTEVAVRFSTALRSRKPAGELFADY